MESGPIVVDASVNALRGGEGHVNRTSNRPSGHVTTATSLIVQKDCPPVQTRI